MNRCGGGGGGGDAGGSGNGGGSGSGNGSGGDNVLACLPCQFVFVCLLVCLYAWLPACPPLASPTCLLAWLRNAVRPCFSNTSPSKTRLATTCTTVARLLLCRYRCLCSFSFKDHERRSRSRT